jgi:hypothetical protein
MQWITLIAALVGALGGGVLGNLLTQSMTDRRERIARALAFRRQQLEQFYGPLLAMHNEIRARSELRVKLQRAIDDEDNKHMLSVGPGKTGSAILANVLDENETFLNVLMPRYREMIEVFRQKMWLAEPETREYFNYLIEFVDVWDKILDEKLPRPIAPAIGHTEENLRPFYRHLEEVHDRLRFEIR